MKKTLLFSVLMFFINITYAQWEADVRLTNDPSVSETNLNQRCIATSGNNVHVVWIDARDGNQEIYYKHSGDKGLTWGGDIRLTNAPGPSRFHSLAASGLYVHVVWMDSRNGAWMDEIFYKNSVDGGLTWGPDMMLTNSPGNSANPSIASTGPVVHVAWSDLRDGLGGAEIYYKRSADGGLTWGPDTRLTNATGSSGNPSVVASGSEVHVVWGDARNGNAQIYYKRSMNGGLTWGEDIQLSNSTSYAAYPNLAISGSVLHLVWHDHRNPPKDEIYYKRSQNGGLTWGPDVRLTNDPAASETPFVEASGSCVHVVWNDDRDADKEVYYKLSQDGGTTWGLDTKLINSPVYSGGASISISSPVIHVIWADSRDGNNEIYYKRTDRICVQNDTLCNCGVWGSPYAFITNYPQSPNDPKPVPLICGGVRSYEGPKSLSISVLGNYICNPTNCIATYTWSVEGPVNGNGSGKQFNFYFSSSGTYYVKIKPKCGNFLCDPCIFTINIKRTYHRK